MKTLDETLHSMSPADKEQTRLLVEYEMAKKGVLGTIPPPPMPTRTEDKLEAVTDLLLILVDKYRRIGRFLTFGSVVMVLCFLAIAYMTYVNSQLRDAVLAVQEDQKTLLTQQRETRRDIELTRDKVIETSRAMTATKEAVEAAADDVPKIEIDPKTKTAKVVVPVQPSQPKKPDILLEPKVKLRP